MTAVSGEKDTEVYCFWDMGGPECISASAALHDPAVAAYVLETIQRNEEHAQAFGKSGAIYSDAAKERLRQVASQPQQAAKADFSDIATVAGGVLGGAGGYAYVGRTRAANHAAVARELEVLGQYEKALAKDWGVLGQQHSIDSDLARLREGKDSRRAITEQEARAKTAKMEKRYTSQADKTAKALQNVKSTPSSGPIGRSRQFVGGAIGATGGALTVKAATYAGKILVKAVPVVGWASSAKDVCDHASEAAELTPRERAEMEIENRKVELEKRRAKLRGDK